MNERIRELAEQAGITTNIDTDYFEKDMNKWLDYYSHKFAQLIVQECITSMNEMPRYARTPITKDIENATIEDCINTVKNCFGVE
jgi:hypothetical protein